ncbi:M14 family metallopeptidase [Streptomyces sp. RS10V-4]|uniref:M14 family metallopeptidase n=1 Tax=Streptomyces rhizoryzae TaxID=2932493 RepID=UPI0020036935|nr:M14 family metallopeptidase [Streptomyces rhizoryzae]MCK7624284.1 M14 family metallopeptidase [Streptomyces rhizoryzae]
MTYFNTDEVDSALVNLSRNDRNCELIELPERSVEGVTCHALRLGSRPTGTRDCVLLIGGVHAREWGSCEILICFAADLLLAYRTGSGLAYGGRRFTADQVRGLLDNLEIIVFPLVNPDGRRYSQNTEAMWRKNRNPAYGNGKGDCVGVDLNRNYDFLFDAATAFSPTSGVRVSTDPCDPQLYQGPQPFSEPETRNVRWLLDAYPRTRWFVDVHSYSEDMLYVWGDDEDQSTDPSMNFGNHAFDGLRGDAGDARYREYIPASDLAQATGLARDFAAAVHGVRGTDYTAKSAFDLYPTCGSSDDYAFARHLTDPARGKVLAYTIEWGTEFQPQWDEMENIIKDISAGLLQFCVSARSMVGTRTAATTAA